MWQGFDDLLQVLEFVVDSLVVHELFEVVEGDDWDFEVGEKPLDEIWIRVRVLAMMWGLLTVLRQS